jgi:hypothetical protein
LERHLSGGIEENHKNTLALMAGLQVGVWTRTSWIQNCNANSVPSFDVYFLVSCNE